MAGLLAGVLLLAPGPACAVDVYLVYSSADKGLQKRFKKSLVPELSVRSYNIDLLALADYSGRQKALAKILKAGLVVIIKARPREIIGELSAANIIYVEGTEDLSKIKDRAGRSDGEYHERR